MENVKAKIFSWVNAFKLKFVGDRILVEASALTYVTLLSFVPLFAVLISIFGAFITKAEFDQKLLAYLDKFFLPESAQVIMLYLKEFSAKAKALGITGFIILISLALVLFESAESTMNKIWRVRRGRSFLNKLFVFTNFVFWIPLLLGLAVYYSYVFVKFQFVGGLLLSLALVFLGFFIFNFIIPNCKVEIKAAVLGAFISSVLWILLKHFFDVYVTYALSFRAMKNIYGSLFILPMFMVWVYFSWVIALIGSIIAYIKQFGCEVYNDSYGVCNFWNLFKVLKLLDIAFEEGKVLTFSELVKRTNIHPDKLSSVLNLLVDCDLVASSDEGYLLKRDLSKVEVRQIFDLCFSNSTSDFIDKFLSFYSSVSIKEFLRASN